MELAEALLKTNSVRQRILEAKAGRGEYPSQEEIKEAILALRQGRAAAADTKPSKGTKAASVPVDLNALFAGLPKPEGEKSS